MLQFFQRHTEALEDDMIDPMILSDVKACTSGQGAYIDSLLTSLESYPEYAEMAVAWREDMRTSYLAHDFSMRKASLAITHLELQVENARAVAEVDMERELEQGDPCAVQSGVWVPKGYYAVETDEGATNALAFYRVTVSKDETTRWVSHQLSGSFLNLPTAQAESVLWKIAVDPKAAMARYGQELGMCGNCHRPLTNDESRAIGLGPICADKL